MTITQEQIIIILTAISSLGTFIATLFTLFNFLELRKQRIQSFTPALIFDNCNLFLYYFPGKNPRFSFTTEEIKIENESKGLELSNSNNRNQIIPIINLGSPAKNVTLKWDFEIQKMIEQIRSMDSNKIFDIELQKDKLRIDSDTFGYKMMFLLQNDMNLNRPIHISTYNSSSKNIMIYLPSSFLTLYSIYLAVAFSFFNLNSNKNHEVLRYNQEFEEIKCTISYQDIHGNNFTAVEKLRLEFAIVTHPDIISNNIQKLGQFNISGI